MAHEIEAKYRLADPAAMRALLLGRGAECVGRVLEINRIFDTPDGALRRADSGLRIRVTQPPDDAPKSDASPQRATLTFKGPRCAGPLKSREEIETEIGDAAALAELLQRLGFRETVRYEKRREAWRVGLCEVALDELPRLGWFVEVEGPSAESVESVCADLHLGHKDRITETYVALAAAKGEPDGRGGRRLVFRDEADKASKGTS